MNLVIVCSISLVMFGLGKGRMVDMWVIFDSRQVLVMLTFAMMVSLIVDHWKISCLTDLIALCQLMSRCLRSPVRAKGEFSMEMPVVWVICRSSGAFPNKAYFVLETFVVRPEIALNMLSMSRMCVSCCVGWVYAKKRFMSSA